jgi:hypothetical protein
LNNLRPSADAVGTAMVTTIVAIVPAAAIWRASTHFRPAMVPFLLPQPPHRRQPAGMPQSVSLAAQVGATVRRTPLS